jgi:hypothetical protein
MDLAIARDLSIILLAIEAIILVAVPGVIFYFSIKGLRQGTRWLKITGLPEAQRYTRLMADKTNEYSARIADPITKVDAAGARARTTASATWQGLRRRRQRSKHV